MKAINIERLNDLREGMAKLYAAIYAKVDEPGMAKILKELVALSQEMDQLYMDADAQIMAREAKKRGAK